MRRDYACLVTLVLITACSNANGDVQPGRHSPFESIVCHQKDTGDNTCSENGNAGLMISENDIPSLQARALQGSGESALTLGNYYEFVKGDLAEGNYWITVSAEDGYPVGMYSLGAFLNNGTALSKSSRTHDPKLRARYWLQRAQDAGYQPASDLLRRMDQFETK